jgi:hypothetical protein
VRPKRNRNHTREPKFGSYVLATKYNDGDPGDHYAVGYLNSPLDHFGQKRYIVVDNNGKPFRANGFRRCEEITDSEGRWLIEHFHDFKPFELTQDEEGNDVCVGWSLWDWLAYRRREVSAGGERIGGARAR